MKMDFHNPNNRFTYSTREADVTWVNKINEIGNVEGKKVLDIGCGGGIYTKAFANMGASFVCGLDFSEELLTTAKENCKDYSNISFRLGNALDTGLDNEQFDIVLVRAVIHHIQDLNTCFNEIYRVLKPNGVLLLQDRTSDDCLIEGSETHIRGYFFTKFPNLINKEISRRPITEKVFQVLLEIGFNDLKEYKLWETRRLYNCIEELETDLLNRTGRSILHELNDGQLKELVLHIKEQLGKIYEQSIIEKDRWTIWKAVK